MVRRGHDDKEGMGLRGRRLWPILARRQKLVWEGCKGRMFTGTVIILQGRGLTNNVMSWYVLCGLAINTMVCNASYIYLMFTGQE